MQNAKRNESIVKHSFDSILILIFYVHQELGEQHILGDCWSNTLENKLLL